MTDQNKKLLVDLLKEGKISNEEFETLYHKKTTERKPEKSHFLRNFFISLLIAGAIGGSSYHLYKNQKEQMLNQPQQRELLQQQQAEEQRQEQIEIQKELEEFTKYKKKLEEYIDMKRVGSCLGIYQKSKGTSFENKIRNLIEQELPKINLQGSLNSGRMRRESGSYTTKKSIFEEYEINIRQDLPKGVVLDEGKLNIKESYYEFYFMDKAGRIANVRWTSNPKQIGKHFYEVFGPFKRVNLSLEELLNAYKPKISVFDLKPFIEKEDESIQQQETYVEEINNKKTNHKKTYSPRYSDWDEWEFHSWEIYGDENLAIKRNKVYLDSLKRDHGSNYNNYEWEYFLVCDITARALNNSKKVDFYGNFYLTDTYGNDLFIHEFSGQEFYKKLNPGKVKRVWDEDYHGQDGDLVTVGSSRSATLSRKIPFSIAREEIHGTRVDVLPHIDFVRFVPELKGLIFLHYKGSKNKIEIYNFDKGVRHYQRQREK